MSGVSWEDSLHEGLDGRRFLTIADAADFRGVSPDTVRREYTLYAVRDHVTLPKFKGRPPTHVVDAADVEPDRNAHLARLRVLDELCSSANARTNSRLDSPRWRSSTNSARRPRRRSRQS